MKKIIVTTTIYPPSKALKKFIKMKDWSIIIVGDKKTPHDIYKKLEKKYKNLLYLSPVDQEKKYKRVSDSIGWNCIMRRNIGFIEAYHQGAEIIATIDDDNVPYDNWGKNIFVNKEIEIDLYEPNNNIFDPLSITNHKYLWHRGYPIELLQTKNNVNYLGKTKRKVLIQADLWDGDPDIDALARLTYSPIVKFNQLSPYGSNKISPFNSQNTFLSRTVLPYYAVLPHVGRMDDIWGGYILQLKFPNSIIYNRATVYQDRDAQNIVSNLEKEILGYRNSFSLVMNLEEYDNYLPDETKKFYDLYISEYNKVK